MNQIQENSEVKAFDLPSFVKLDTSSPCDDDRTRIDLMRANTRFYTGRLMDDYVSRQKIREDQGKINFFIIVAFFASILLAIVFGWN